MSRSTRKPTLWTLRNVSTQISMRSSRMLIWASLIPSQEDRGIVLWFLKQENPQQAKHVSPG